MKTLCSKSGKGGKIHPSPSADDSEQTTAALRLLPTAIFVLAVVLRPESQQVVAYLVTRSLQGAAAPEPQAVRRHPHSPAIGCDCFDCYTSFWSRWDCSPERDDIHRVIDAFEAHLADAEAEPASSTPSSSKRRDKGKRKTPPSPPTQLMCPDKPGSQSRKVQEPTPAPASPPPPPPLVPVAKEDEEEKVQEDSSKVEADAAAVENADAGKEEEEEERKRGWADVMGMLNLRLWGIWSPTVEQSSTP